MKQPATKIAGLVAEELHLITKDALKKVCQAFVLTHGDIYLTWFGVDANYINNYNSGYGIIQMVGTNYCL